MRYVSQLGMGEQCMLPPGVMTNTYLYSFALPADEGKLQEMVNQQLTNVCAGTYEFRVLGSHVLASFLSAERMTSGAQAVGYLPDHEWSLFVPVLAFRSGEILPFGLFLYPLLVVVDTCIAMATGREIWGWKKEVGAITVPRPGDPTLFLTQATVFPKFGPDTQGVLGDLMRIEAPSPIDHGAPAWRSSTEAFTGIGGALAKVWGGEMLGRMIAPLLGRLFSGLSSKVVTLKQFRAADDANQACYQALIESSLSIDKVYSGGLITQPLQVEIADPASHALVSKLGLSPRGRADLAIWIQCDFSAPAGRVLWP